MKGSDTTVGDVMTRAVVALGRDAPFKEIVATMDRWKVGALPVLEGDGRVVGVVSEADLLPKEEFRASGPNAFDLQRRQEEVEKAGAVTADRLMSAPAACVHAGSTVAEAARIMAVRHVKRLPVTDDADRLVGIVSRGDLLKVFLRTDDEIAAEVRREVVAELFPAGSEVCVEVHDGRVLLHGTVPEPTRIALATRLTRAVEGVVDVRNELHQADRAATT